VGIIFTRRLTNGLQMLFEATQELSKGNFEINPIIKGNDEIASLTDSFVDMKNKILKFMDEMKEKSRIENEIQIAKLVQDSFFPKSYLSGNGFSLFGHYRPATECSGDWWGVLEQGNKITIIVCDATGHGVGAALVTAAAHSSLSSLNYISPKMILSRMNRVICEMNSEIMMTAFALEINRLENKIIYSNASHVPPFVLPLINGEYSKNNINPLMDNNSSRLGENLHTIYTDTELSISINDKILLFSDGIIEASNGSKNYGQRNFIKSFTAHANSNVENMIKGIIQDLEAFQEGELPDDDITLIGLEINDVALEVTSLEDINKLANVSLGKPIISCLDNQSNVESLLSQYPIHHLVGFNSKNINKEFDILNKIQSAKLYSFKKIFNVSRNYYQQELFFNKNIGQEIALLIDNCQPFFEFALKSPQVQLVLDELLSNAFYHSKASPGFSRGEEIILIPGDKINLNYFYDDEYLVISVKGPGSFKDASVITQSINRGIKEKSPIEGEFGAGLGLYLIYDNVSQFWVVNSPDVGSEMICVFEKFSRNKQLKERVTSFHYLEMEFDNE
jgi:sigma-B regulation protein RsbU (phosphoserine phosphatase)